MTNECQQPMLFCLEESSYFELKILTRCNCSIVMLFTRVELNILVG